VDELTRQASLRALTALLTVFMVGTTAIALVDRAIGDGAVASPTPSPSQGSTETPEPVPTTTPIAWLAWVPGGLPEGFGDGLPTVGPIVTPTSTATADIAWLVRSLDAGGNVVDLPTAPYLLPIDTTGVGPTFASFLPDPQQRLVADLKRGQGVLSESEAALRGLGKGSTLEFERGLSVEIVGTLPDVMMGGYELLVTRKTGERIGVTHERYVLFNVRPNVDPAPQQLAASLLPYLPIDAPYPYVEVRAPGQATYLRANDRELPPELLKEVFGEFSAAPPSPTNPSLEIDPTWVGDHIVSREVPLLGTVTCHEKAIGFLKKAMKALNDAASADSVTSIGTCFDPGAGRDGPNGVLSARIFGGAIDLNQTSNRVGDLPSQPKELVKIMSRSGFGWGGKDAYPQGALFRFRRPPP
jgi:hypothetical protein